MTGGQRVEMTPRQTEMIAEAMTAVVQAKQRYDAMVGLLLAGADVPAGSQYEIRIAERAIVINPAPAAADS